MILSLTVWMYGLVLKNFMAVYIAAPAWMSLYIAVGSLLALDWIGAVRVGIS